MKTLASFTGPLPRSFGLPVVPHCKKATAQTKATHYGQESRRR